MYLKDFFFDYNLKTVLTNWRGADILIVVIKKEVANVKQNQNLQRSGVQSLEI